MPPRSAFDRFRRDSEGRMQAAALRATAKAARTGLTSLRDQMGRAGLGRLGQGLGSGSDADKRGVVRPSGNGWSASGWIHIRSGSERSRGTIEAYTDGADITPKRSPYLWISTDQIPLRAGRERMTPALYIKRGFDRKIGPLIPATADDGTPLLLVRNVGVSASGKSRSARSLTKGGRARKGQVQTDVIVAFFGIRRTSRAARVDVQAIIDAANRSLPGLIAAELNRR